MLTVLILVAVLLASHELGHIVTTVGLGGRFRGLVFRGLAIGVSLDLTGLSIRRRLQTVWAGTLSEILVAGALSGLSLAGIVNMRLMAWALVIVAADATLNLGPWWSKSDGALIRSFWGQGHRRPHQQLSR